MSTNTLPPASCFHDTLKALGTSIRLHAERQGSACPCYPIVQFVLDPLPFLHHWLSLPETQCHGSLSAIAGELTPYGDSTFNITTDTVEASHALDVGSPSLSSPSPMEPDFIHQSLLDTTLDTNTGMDALYLSGLDHLEGHNFNLEPFPEFSNSFLPELSNSFLPELSMTPSMDHASSQMWSPHTLPQSPDTSSSNGSLSYDYTWTNEPAHDCFIDPLSHDIQPHVQNSSDVYLSSVCSGNDLDSLTSLWLDEGRSECAISMDDMGSTPSLCRWGDGSCTSLLTSDKSEVGKHLQVLHGVKSGGDKERMLCSWDGCGKEMKKESISRHVAAIHLSNKTECGSCGKQFARLDSKLRHLKNSRREECRESEPHDSRTKRRRLSWP